jgi:hypothetical protein
MITMTTLNEEPDIPVAELDLHLVGDLLTRLPATAAMMRHASVQSTLDYILEDPEEPEQAFVRDILTLPLPEVLDKWYGGHLYATALGTALVAAAMKPGEVRPSSPLAEPRP